MKAKFELLRAIRNVRSQYLLPPSTRIDIHVVPADEDAAVFLNGDLVSLKFLALAGKVTVDAGYQRQGPTGVAVASIGTAYIPLGGLIDMKKERARLEKQEAEILKGIRGIEGKLGNENFVSRAPQTVVDRERERLVELQEQLGRIHEQVAVFKES